MSLADLLTTQIVRGEITVEQAQKSLLAYHHRKARQEKPGPARTLEEVERRTIEEALLRNNGNQHKTAEDLGIARATLYRKLKSWRDEMKIFPIVLAILLMSVLTGVAVAQQGPTREVMGPIKADSNFIELLADWQLITGEIDRLESVSGPVVIPVSIKELRARAAVKEKKMQEWMSSNGIAADWKYDPTTHLFTKPEKKDNEKSK